MPPPHARLTAAPGDPPDADAVDAQAGTPPPVSAAGAPATADWRDEGGDWTLRLAGAWRGPGNAQIPAEAQTPAQAQAPGVRATAALPPFPVSSSPPGQAPRSIVIDASALSDWDARLASALWQALSPLARAHIRIDLSRLPAGLAQILSLSLPPDSSAGRGDPGVDAAAVGTPAVAAAPASVATRAPPARPRDRTGAALRTRLRLALRGVGARATASLQSSKETLAFVGEVLLAGAQLLRGRSDMRAADLAWQIDQTGARSVPIVAVVAFLVGLIVAYMGAQQLQMFGAQSFIATLVTVGVVREIAPLVTGIILSGRVGAAFAAQLGSMRANEEIDALRTLGVDPVGYLVLPRVLALLLAGPLLTAFAALVGMGVGALVAVGLYDVAPRDYANKTLESLSFAHVAVGLVKGTVYALLVALAGCRQGLSAGRSAQDVGLATTAAVVQSIVWIVVAASTLTVVFQRLDI